MVAKEVENEVFDNTKHPEVYSQDTDWFGNCMMHLSPKELAKIGIDIPITASNEEVEAILKKHGKRLYKRVEENFQSVTRGIVVVQCARFQRNGEKSFTPEECKAMGLH